jgi:uncharacterized lipoprotein NlpE involved in copper resistance
MNRRVTTVALLTAPFALLGCDSKNKSETEWEMHQLDSAISDLEANMQDFDDHDWRAVVHEMTTTARNIRYAFDNLRSSLKS